MKRLLFATIILALLLACGSGQQVARPTEVGLPPATAAPADTPAPTDTPPPPVEPIVLTGSGDDVVDTGKPEVPMLVVISGNQESKHFGVTALDANNKQLDLLVNTTEPYSGIRPVDFKGNRLTTRLKISASGPWRIELQPLSTARRLAVPGEIAGQGDDVIMLTGGVPDLAEISGNADGRFFGVIGYGSSSDLLVNTTDPYEGQVIVAADTLLLVVQAVGDWRISVKAK